MATKPLLMGRKAWWAGLRSRGRSFCFLGGAEEEEGEAAAKPFHLRLWAESCPAVHGRGRSEGAELLEGGRGAGRPGRSGGGRGEGGWPGADGKVREGSEAGLNHAFLNLIGLLAGEEGAGVEGAGPGAGHWS